VIAILDKLDNPEDRELIMMRDLDGLSFEEIGALLSTPANNARMRHFRAIKRLRALWRKQFPDDESDSDASADE
jgi:DNA-directed RNA polymerase specialized sigma24 family protein